MRAGPHPSATPAGAVLAGYPAPVQRRCRRKLPQLWDFGRATDSISRPGGLQDSCRGPESECRERNAG